MYLFLIILKKVDSNKPKNPIEEYAEDIHSFYMRYEVFFFLMCALTDH
jgi:hypothetical protein